MDIYDTEPKPKKSFWKSHKVLYPIFILCFIILALYSIFRAPTETLGIVNKQGITLHVSKGESLADIIKEAKEKKLVRSEDTLKIFITLLGASHKIPIGDYVFRESVSLPTVALRLATGRHGIEPLKITLKEGLTNEDMADVLSGKIATFRRDLFLSDEKSKQGYLFPDTYFFFPMTTTEEILDELTNNFKNRIKPFENDISKSGHSMGDIIVMASLIEKEASGPNDAPIISGILWKRIGKGMPLQVDADRSTYKNAGLPQAPIANPGLVSIKASLYPSESPYLYYIHDKDGDVHFAENYTKHKANIAKYLK